MLNELMLLCGNDIPFLGGGITLHQPTIKEIGYIGEEQFFIGLEMLKFDKKSLSEKDRIHLKDTHVFDILIAILKEQSAVMKKNSICTRSLLELIFPNYDIKFSNSIEIIDENNQVSFINKENFQEFQNILVMMFSYPSEENDKEAINPSGEMARGIAEKLQKRHEKLAKLKGGQKIDILARYLSILAIALGKDINQLKNLTVYQLYDMFKRFELKTEFDLYKELKMAGSKDLKEVQHWMESIHSQK